MKNNTETTTFSIIDSNYGSGIKKKGASTRPLKIEVSCKKILKRFNEDPFLYSHKHGNVKCQRDRRTNSRIRLSPRIPHGRDNRVRDLYL